MPPARLILAVLLLLMPTIGLAATCAMPCCSMADMPTMDCDQMAAASTCCMQLGSAVPPVPSQPMAAPIVLSRALHAPASLHLQHSRGTALRDTPQANSRERSLAELGVLRV